MNKVAVVGGSLSGLWAAIAAAEYGAKVTLFERKSNIGDFYGGEVFTQIYGLPKPEGVHYAAENFVFHVNNTCYVKLPPNTIWMIDRDVYQEALAKKAASLGVDIRLSTHAGYLHDLRHSFDVVIDASGCPSVTYCEYGLGKIKETATALYYLSSGDFTKYNHDLHMWWLSQKTLGYFWIFPKANGTKANLGIGWVHGAGRPPHFSDVDDWLTRLGVKQTIDEKGGHIIPVVPLKKKRYGNLLLVGDAAGLMNSTLAAGNHLAATSGKIAGMLAAQDASHRYEHVLNRTIGMELSNSQILYRIQKRLPFDAFERYFPAMGKTGPKMFFSRMGLLEVGLRYAWSRVAS